MKYKKSRVENFEVVAPMFKKLSLKWEEKMPTLFLLMQITKKHFPLPFVLLFANQGQICLCGSRIYVEKSIYDRFVKDFPSTG
ncbi:MAG: aldehyde dehydrogenase family protein [Bacteroidia bacterium]